MEKEFRLLWSVMMEIKLMEMDVPVTVQQNQGMNAQEALKKPEIGAFLLKFSMKFIFLKS